MRILLINNYHYRRGGVETHFLALSELLKSRGHEVITFSMANSLNEPSAFEPYFVDYIDYPQLLSKTSLSSARKVLSKAFYSFESKKKLQSLIDKVKPDIAHLHNIHQIITPSVIGVLKKARIPVFWTLHDYNIICPAISFYRNGKPCEQCMGGRYYRTFLNKCKRNSYGASFVAAAQSYLYRWGNFYSPVRKFIVPSRFLGQKMIEHGISESKVHVLPNFLDASVFSHSQKNAGAFILYAGRLAPEKGLKTLIEAVKPLDCNLKIVGTGSEEKELKSVASSSSPLKAKIEFLGFMNPDELAGLYRSCKFVVLPSEWYENSPYGILEAFAYAKPVVGSNIGGIPELIENGQTGLLFDPGKSIDLRNNISKLLKNKGLIVRMGNNAKNYVSEYHGFSKYYKELISLYNKDN